MPRLVNILLVSPAKTFPLNDQEYLPGGFDDALQVRLNDPSLFKTVLVIEAEIPLKIGHVAPLLHKRFDFGLLSADV